MQILGRDDAFCLLLDTLLDADLFTLWWSLNVGRWWGGRVVRVWCRYLVWWCTCKWGRCDCCWFGDELDLQREVNGILFYSSTDFNTHFTLLWALLQNGIDRVFTTFFMHIPAIVAGSLSSHVESQKRAIDSKKCNELCRKKWWEDKKGVPDPDMFIGSGLLDLVNQNNVNHPAAQN